MPAGFVPQSKYCKLITNARCLLIQDILLKQILSRFFLQDALIKIAHIQKISSVSQDIKLWYDFIWCLPLLKNYDKTNLIYSNV